MNPVPTTMEWLHRAARRISTGTPVLLGRLIRRSTKAASRRAGALHGGAKGWLGESTGILDTLLRWALLGVCALIAYGAAKPLLRAGVHILSGARWLMWPAFLVYVVSAYRAGAPPAPDVAAGTETGTGGTPEPERPAVPREAFLTLLHTELREVRTVHLWYLAKHLQKDYPARQWDVPAVAALCAAHGIPVQKKIRAHGKGATRGVRKQDLPPLTAGTPAPPLETVDTAAQNPSTSTSTGPSTGPGGGAGEKFTTAPDPARAQRTRVLWTGRDET